MSQPKIRCRDIAYRQGFIEVLPNIHPGHVNLEVWNVRFDIDLAKFDWGDEALDDGACTGNVELELSVDEARELVRCLQDSIAAVTSIGV